MFSDLSLHIRGAAALVALLALGAFSATAQAPAADAATSTEPAAPADAAAAAPAMKGDTVVARVNDRKITLADVARMAQKLNVSPESRASLVRQIIDALIDQSVLSEKLTQEKYPVDEKAVDEAFEKGRAAFPSAEAMKEELAKENLTEDALKTKIREELMKKTYLDSVRNGISVPDEEIQKAYDKLKTENKTVRTKDTVRVGHFYVAVPKDSDESVWDKAKEKADRAYKRVTEGKEDFAKVTAELSDDKGLNDKGAPYEEHPRGRMPVRLDKVLFETSVGQVSTPLRMDDGYHFVKVYAKFDAGSTVALDDIKESLRQGIATKKASEKVASEVAAARKTMTVDILYRDDDAPMAAPSAESPATPAEGSASSTPAAPSSSASPDADLLTNESL